ncbi:unnamed protein product [Kluyveromyces dobzhanskii CBS 2104]|uniref:WGS project CCBQ000000000 data, contig 00015 n=1 Tax=Kluyveromyces dobzhanskii CBS 2104 TaxID=1427455 RepID=A0A0A8LBW7_9SACH|nr:unnamed protein product [Kluyveromyces dobzhanskii CBS 2104]
MRVQSLVLSIFGFVQCCIATAIVLNDAVVSFGSGNAAVELGTIDNKYDSKGLNVPVSVSETLKISFVTEQDLVQANLLVGLPEENLEAGYSLSRDSGSSNKFSLNVPLSKIAGAFEDKSQLLVTLLASTHEQSLVRELFLLSINDAAGEEQYALKNVVRLGPKNEIHHVFQGAPKTVNAFVARIFALAIASISLLLLATWVSFGVVSFNLKSLSSYVFVGLISGFEFVFYKYYSDTSIFDTILYASFLVLPTLLCGAATLKSLKR